MAIERITELSFESARNLFKSQRDSWQIKTIVDKNGKQRKVRVAPDSASKKPEEVLRRKESKVRDDKEIIHDILHGTPSQSMKAKSELYENHYKDGYRIIYTFIQGKGFPEEKQLADDLTSDAFVKVYTNIADFDSEEFKSLPFKTWFTRTCSNTARDYLRGFDAFTKQNAASDEEMAARFNSATSDSNPYDQVVAEEQATMIRDAINKLPEAYSEPIKLYYFQELTAKEVADKLGISTTAVTARLDYARKMLKRTLDEGLFKAVLLYFEYKEQLKKNL